VRDITDLERKVEEWAKTALSIEIEPSPKLEKWDWMDEEYVRRKLGLKLGESRE
jgi:hypothetical protein